MCINYLKVVNIIFINIFSTHFFPSTNQSSVEQIILCLCPVQYTEHFLYNCLPHHDHAKRHRTRNRIVQEHQEQIVVIAHNHDDDDDDKSNVDERLVLGHTLHCARCGRRRRLRPLARLHNHHLLHFRQTPPSNPSSRHDRRRSDDAIGPNANAQFLWTSQLISDVDRLPTATATTTDGVCQSV